LRLHRLEVSGFRGINEPMTLEPKGKSLLLVGENGVGKTSILQSIEWALLGDVSFLEGDEFKREDALANLFNENKMADVKIEVKDNKGDSLRIARARKALSKTKGKSSLAVDVDGKSLRSVDAEIELIERLRISPEQYSTTVHLHQEVIRQLVEGDERDRTRAINRILGIDLLSSFTDILTKQLHASSSVNKSFRAMQSIVENLSNERKGIDHSIIEEKRTLEETNVRLKKKGISVEEPDQAINSVFSEAKNTMISVAKETEAQKPGLRLSVMETPTPKVDKLEKSLDDLRDIKRDLASNIQKTLPKRRKIYSV